MEVNKLTIVDILEAIIPYFEKVHGEKYSKAKLAEIADKKLKTFYGNLQRKSISFEDLLPIAEELRIDLNKFKGKLKRYSVDPSEFLLRAPECYGLESMSAILNPNMCVIGINPTQNKAVFKRLITDSLQANGKILIINPSGKGSGEYSTLAGDIPSENYFISADGNEEYAKQFSLSSPFTYIGFDWSNDYNINRKILGTILKEAQDKGVTKVFISNAVEVIKGYFLDPATLKKFDFQIIAEAYATFEIISNSDVSDELKRIFPSLLFLEFDHYFYVLLEKFFNITEAYNTMHDKYPNEKMGILNTPYRTNELIKL